jgi:thiamine-phosphate pyrophosphorylase
VVRSQKRPEFAAGFPAFYPILDTDVAESRALDPLDVCRAWLDAGVTLLQLRAKRLQGAALLALAEACVRIASDAGAAVIINDRADVASLSGAAGVHLGQDDLRPGDIRRLLPAPALVGWSTHNDDQVRIAADMPVDYLAIGPVFGTHSKQRPDPVVGLDGVRRAVALAAGRPVVAIGGITLETAPAVIAAGASSIAVIGDVLRADVAAQARAYLAALE